MRTVEKIISDIVIDEKRKLPIPRTLTSVHEERAINYGSQFLTRMLASKILNAIPDDPSKFIELLTSYFDALKKVALGDKSRTMEDISKEHASLIEDFFVSPYKVSGDLPMPNFSPTTELNSKNRVGTGKTKGKTEIIKSYEKDGMIYPDKKIIIPGTEKEFSVYHTECKTRLGKTNRYVICDDVTREIIGFADFHKKAGDVIQMSIIRMAFDRQGEGFGKALFTAAMEDILNKNPSCQVKLTDQTHLYSGEHRKSIGITLYGTPGKNYSVSGSGDQYVYSKKLTPTPAHAALSHTDSVASTPSQIIVKNMTAPEPIALSEAEKQQLIATNKDSSIALLKQIYIGNGATEAQVNTIFSQSRQHSVEDYLSALCEEKFSVNPAAFNTINIVSFDRDTGILKLKVGYDMPSVNSSIQTGFNRFKSTGYLSENSKIEKELCDLLKKYCGDAVLEKNISQNFTTALGDFANAIIAGDTNPSLFSLSPDFIFNEAMRNKPNVVAKFCVLVNTLCEPGAEVFFLNNAQFNFRVSPSSEARATAPLPSSSLLVEQGLFNGSANKVPSSTISVSQLEEKYKKNAGILGRASTRESIFGKTGSKVDYETAITNMQARLKKDDQGNVISDEKSASYKTLNDKDVRRLPETRGRKLDR